MIGPYSRSADDVAVSGTPPPAAGGRSSSSRLIYDVSEFNSITSSASIASPALKQPYHLTAAKVKQSDRLVDYEPLPPVTIAPYNNMKAPATSKKRAHDQIDDGDEDRTDEDEEDDDDDTLVV